MTPTDRLVDTSAAEEALVVGLVSGRPGRQAGGQTRREQVHEYLRELMLLADTAGVFVRGQVVQERDRINPATFIGPGKAEEVGKRVLEEGIKLVIFDDDLSPIQVRNLERYIPCKIIDRSGLILDIFARRAKSKEAMTQVELAQLEYLLPRLTRQWTHLSKQYGGVGTKGPGEQQIETDRRAIRTRIGHLKERLGRISKEREVQRRGRRDLIRVALVGYTNAGKSTLLKLLSGADVLVENRLFATLDTTVRQVALAPGRKILLSDTVGFIRKLPPHLIATFRSTLSEVTESDILLHVVDVSHAGFEEQIAVVNDTLGELNAAGKPTLFVFNKIDLLGDRAILAELGAAHSPSVAVSASRGINISGLRQELLKLVEEDSGEHTLLIKQSEYRTLAKLHEIAEIICKEYDGDAVRVHFRVTKKNLQKLRSLLGGKKASRQ